MANCTCTWAPVPAPADFGPNDIKYDQKTEILEVKVTIKGTANTTAGQGHHIVDGKGKLSAYEWDGTRWSRIHKGKLVNFQTVQINCADKAASSPYVATFTDKFDVDAAYIAGRQRLILLQVYFEVTGTCGTAGGFNMMRRIGLQLTAATPPTFQVQTAKGAWGPAQNTDGNWVLTTPIPSDP